MSATLGRTARRRVVGRPRPHRHQRRPDVLLLVDARDVRPPYLGEVSRARLFLSRFGLDLLSSSPRSRPLSATALTEDLVNDSGPLKWFEVGAIGATVLLLLARHRFPFAAPAAMWLAARPCRSSTAS